MLEIFFSTVYEITQHLFTENLSMELKNISFAAVKKKEMILADSNSLYAPYVCNLTL